MFHLRPIVARVHIHAEATLRDERLRRHNKSKEGYKAFHERGSATSDFSCSSDRSSSVVPPVGGVISAAPGNGCIKLRTGTWAVGAAGEVVHLPAGQTEWTRADLGMQIYTWLRSVDFADAQHGWLVGGFGTILHTDDGGKTWRLCLGV